MDVDNIETISSQRIEELWFADGNIILQAGNTQFRLYKGILAARSPIFRDMLALPQPPEAELVDGCPVVEMHDDSAELAIFFSAIFIPQYFAPFPNETTFDKLYACLHISHKYDVEYIYRRSLIHLSSGYCTTLEKFDEYVYNSHLLNPLGRPSWGLIVQRTSESSTPISETAKSVKFVRRLRLIALALSVDALWLLPNALLSLCREIPTPIDLAQALLPDDSESESHDESISGSLNRFLPKPFVARLLHGYGALQHDPFDLIAYLTDPMDIEGCEDPSRCFRSRVQTAHRAHRRISQHPLTALHSSTPRSWERVLSRLCPVCGTSLTEARKAARQRAWDKLPVDFGLPPWPELERMKAEASGPNLFC
ncbi:BTB domain-containing protein [Mycena indigotica]|uniref:BTB domain-containing protein n=1 Tax=Mycena indigotica TaxID=2126181 RepID=A0A8H6TCT3_9AGAR|nr:BTB domain-containing protein [Mycena indigotica]KAF7314944.1 BTB domain-containing protein [Mycena indigotica]